MDLQLRYRLTKEISEIERSPSTRWNAYRVYTIAAIQSAVAAVVVVAAIHLVGGKISNWYVVPLVLAALLILASATYSVVTYNMNRKLLVIMHAILDDVKSEVYK